MNLSEAIQEVRRTAKDQMIRCPGHADDTPSLGVSLGADGRILIYCYAGCDPDRVLQAAGVDWDDLFTESTPYRNKDHTSVYQPSVRTKEATWDWKSSRLPADKELEHWQLGRASERWDIYDGPRLFAIKLRWNLSNDKKTIRWWRNGWGLDGLSATSSPLYLAWDDNLSLRKTTAFVVEGESATFELGRRYPTFGTCCGSSAVPVREALEVLRPYERLILWPDNDIPGRKHMFAIRRELISMGINPEMFIPEDRPGWEQGHDAADFFEQGRDLKEELGL